MSSMAHQRRCRRTTRFFAQGQPDAWPARRCWYQAPGDRHPETRPIRSSDCAHSGWPGPGRSGRRCGPRSRSARPASPRPGGGCVPDGWCGAGQRSGRGYRLRSHIGRRSGAGLAQQVATSSRHGCRRTCVAYVPNRMPVALHHPSLPSPDCQTRHSRRPEAVRGNLSDGWPDAPPCGPRYRHKRQPGDRVPARGGCRPHSTKGVRSWCGRCRGRARAMSCRQQTLWAKIEQCSASARAVGRATSRHVLPSCIMWNDPARCPDGQRSATGDTAEDGRHTC